MFTHLHQVIEAQKREISLLRDTITVAKLTMSIVLDQYDEIYEDVNEQWGQPPKADIKENLKAEVDQGQPGQV